MKLPLYQIDAFASQVFRGNPAAVCPLPHWLDDPLLQAIAAENNLSETAYIVEAGEQFQIRWFTPTMEVDLCGHATLASAFVIFSYLHPGLTSVRFSSKSGELKVIMRDQHIWLDLPVMEASPCLPPPKLVEALKLIPNEVLAARDYLVVYQDEEAVQEIQPDFALLKQLDRLGVIVTAPGRSADFVSRFFAPKAGIDEDPVTGSAHCTLIPYWASRLGKNQLTAKQISLRSGELFCEQHLERVLIGGKAVCYLEGTVNFES